MYILIGGDNKNVSEKIHGLRLELDSPLQNLSLSISGVKWYRKYMFRRVLIMKLIKRKDIKYFGGKKYDGFI